MSSNSRINYSKVQHNDRVNPLDQVTLKLSKNYSFDQTYQSIAEEAEFQKEIIPVEDEISKKQILAIRIPAKVVNQEKAINCLGGLQSIKEKNLKGENINFSPLGVELEKCFSFDLLLKRKRYRSKKHPEKVKYKCEVVGQIPHFYSYYALCDFKYKRPSNHSTHIKEFEHFINSKLFKTEAAKIELESLKQDEGCELDSFALTNISVGRNKYAVPFNTTLIENYKNYNEFQVSKEHKAAFKPSNNLKESKKDP